MSTDLLDSLLNRGQHRAEVRAAFPDLVAYAMPHMTSTSVAQDGHGKSGMKQAIGSFGKSWREGPQDTDVARTSAVLEVVGQRQVWNDIGLQLTELTAQEGRLVDEVPSRSFEIQGLDISFVGGTQFEITVLPTSASTWES